MSYIRLRIADAVVETDVEKHQLQGAEPTLREAFRLLAERLQRTPFHQFGNARELAIESLRVSNLPVDELLGPRGAERLAEQLYDELASEMGK